MSVNRRLRGCKCQSDDSEIALKTSSNGSQSAVKWQLNGAYGAANVSQTTAKSHLKHRHMAVSRQANSSQSALTGLQMSVRRQRNHTQNSPSNGSQSAGKWQSIGAYGGANVSQMTAKSHSKRRQTAVSRAVKRRLRGCKCQSDDSEITLKTPSNGSQSAGKWQSNGAYGGANVSQTAAKSHSSRRMIFPPLLWGDQGASQNHRPPKRGNFKQDLRGRENA